MVPVGAVVVALMDDPPAGLDHQRRVGRDLLGEAHCATGNFLEIGTCAERPAGVSDDADPQFVRDRQPSSAAPTAADTAEFTAFWESGRLGEGNRERQGCDIGPIPLAPLSTLWHHRV